MTGNGSENKPWFVQIEEILQGSLVGQVLGIELDLRHPDINTETHHAPNYWEMVLRFPPQGDETDWDETLFLDAASLEGDAAHEIEVQAIEPAADTIELRSGDRLLVRRVEHFFRGGTRELVDAHDNLEYWAHLIVQRADGEIVQVRDPLMFVAKDALEPASEHIFYVGDDDYQEYMRDHSITLEKLKLRARRLTKSWNGQEWLEVARHMLNLLESMDHKLPPDEPWETSEQMEIAATFGYALARAEAEARLYPLAFKKLKADRARARATKLAALKRTKPDTAAILDAATAMCAADANLSLNRCGNELAKRFDREAVNIKRIIKPLFEPRQNSAGRVEYRPIRPRINPLD